VRAAAAPIATGMQYDQIDRLIAAKASPPPPNSFASEYAALDGDASDAAAEKKKRNLLDAIVRRNGGDDKPETLFGGLGTAFASIGKGRIRRYSFYSGWERVDDLLANTATIRKCDLHQLIELDLTKKTYHIVEIAAPAATPESEESAPAASARPEPSPSTRPAPSERPVSHRDDATGTALLDYMRIVRALGAALIGGATAEHFQSTNTIAISQATGSCRDGTFTIAQDEYFAGYAQPHAICPVDFNAPPRDYPRDPLQLVARSGCRTTVATHVEGAAEPAGKLALYSLLAISGRVAGPSASGSPPSGEFSFLTVRGNAHALSRIDAGLFEIPSDFAKLP